MTHEELTEAASKLFPQCRVTDNKIEWVGGGGEWDAAYLCAYRNRYATIDGDMTPSQLQILSAWIVS